MSDITGETFVHVKGLAALQKALDELPAKMEANIMRAALAAGARVIAAQARAICPVEIDPPGNQTYKRSIGWKPGALRKSIRVSTRLLRSGRITATIKAGSFEAYYAHMVEFGTASHWIRASKKKSLFLSMAMREAVLHPGARKNPFMRVAMDAEAQRALVAVGERIRQRLTKEGIEVPDTATGDNP